MVSAHMTQDDGARWGERQSWSTGRWGATAGMSEGGAQRGRPGRPAGVPNRDKAELRALLQERVHEFTDMRAKQDELDNVPPDQRQQIIEEYDPVVALALVAVDRRTSLGDKIKCNAEVAQYVRPKLKSIEHGVDPDTLETIEERTRLSEEIVDALEELAEIKREEGTA
jgi:hypothetical protein